MDISPEQQFTIEEITGALGGLDADAQQTVLNALRQQSELRQSEKNEQNFTGSIIRFAAVYERATAPNANDSNIEGWYDNLHMESEYLLGLLAERDSLTDIEVLVRDTAALSYLHMGLAHGMYDWDASIVVAAGANIDDLLETFRRGVTTASIEAGDDADEVSSVMKENFLTLDDFYYNLHSDSWQHIVQPTATAMRERLIEAGYALPQLNAVGMYGEDDELGAATF